MLQTVELPIELLRPNPWNTNIVTPENEAKLEASIKRVGFFSPIVARQLVDGRYEILCGAHRYEILRRMGYETIPTVNLGIVDDKRAKEISIIDNQRYGADDDFLLDQLLDELGGLDELSEFMPFTNEDLDDLSSDLDIDLDDLEPDDDEEPVSSDKSVRTHQTLTFKVPIKDHQHIENVLDRIALEQGFTSSDSLANAGLSLLHLVNDYSKK